MSYEKNLAVFHLNAHALSYQIGGLSIYFFFHIFEMFYFRDYDCVREGTTSTGEKKILRDSNDIRARK